MTVWVIWISYNITVTGKVNHTGVNSSKLDPIKNPEDVPEQACCTETPHHNYKTQKTQHPAARHPRGHTAMPWWVRAVFLSMFAQVLKCLFPVQDCWAKLSWQITHGFMLKKSFPASGVAVRRLFSFSAPLLSGRATAPPAGAAGDVGLVGLVGVETFLLWLSCTCFGLETAPGWQTNTITWQGNTEKRDACQKRWIFDQWTVRNNWAATRKSKTWHKMQQVFEASEDRSIVHYTSEQLYLLF